MGDQLRVASQLEPYTWTVQPADKPDNRDGWKGMSGGAVCKVGPDDTLHVFGVLQSVPANFSGGRLDVARLSVAFLDELFRNELRVSLGHEPRIIPWSARAPPRPRSGPLAFNIPNLPRHYQPRELDADLRNKLVKLDAGQTVGITGVRGMGGIGKTVLASALAHEASAQARDAPGRAVFTDGVVWLTFGRDAAALTKAADLATALTGQTTRFESLDAARGQLGDMTRDLALLVVLDDVWEPEAADPFTGLGPKCRVLITTRIAPVLTRAGASRHDLGLLAPDAARHFLVASTGLPNADALPAEADVIIRQCGRLPLALAAAGALIRTGTFTWIDAAQALEEGATEDFDVFWLPDPQQRSVAAVLRVSVERLSPEAKACFLACAVFREDVEIPEDALLRLWSGITANQRRAKLMATDLEGRSLLTRDEQHRYRIHDLYVDFLRHAAAPLAARHADLVMRYRNVCPSGWDSCPDDGYILRHLPWHLREAQQAAELRDLLFRFPWLRHKLAYTDIDAVIADYALLPNDREAATLAAALTLSAHLLAREPNQLAHQLHGRLVPAHGPMIAQLLGEVAASCGFAPEWGPYLTPPGAELRRFEGHTSGVTSVAVLPDGRRALSASHDLTLRLWDIETGAELRRFEGHIRLINSVAVLPDGRRALSASGNFVSSLFDHRGVSASADYTLRLWDIETGAELRRFEGHTDLVSSMKVLPNGHRVLSASADYTLRLWDIETGAELRRFEGHRGSINSVAVLSDGHRALSASADYTLRLWDIETGAELRRFEGHTSGVTSVAVLPDGRRALSASHDLTLRLWDIETGAELRRFEGHIRSINSVAVLPDGHRVLSASADDTLRLWDIETGAELRRFEGHTNLVTSVAVLPNGHRALSGSADYTLRLWDIETGTELRRSEGHTDLVFSMTVLPDGHHALSASADKTVRLWNLETRAELRRFEGYRSPVYSVAVLPDGRRALSASGNYTLRLWDIETGAELRRFEGHIRPVYSLAVLPDGHRVLSASADYTLRLWDIKTGAELRRFDGHKGWISSVAVLPDGHRALSASADDTLRLWDIETGAELRRFEGHTNLVTSVAVLPDGRRALSASRDCTLRLWDIETGAELRRFDGHKGSISSVAVLPDGHRVLSASTDDTLRLWDIETGVEYGRYVGDVAFTALTLMHAGDHVLTGNKRGQVVPFRLEI